MTFSLRVAEAYRSLVRNLFPDVVPLAFSRFETVLFRHFESGYRRDTVTDIVPESMLFDCYHIPDSVKEAAVFCHDVLIPGVEGCRIVIWKDKSASLAFELLLEPFSNDQGMQISISFTAIDTAMLNAKAQQAWIDQRIFNFSARVLSTSLSFLPGLFDDLSRSEFNTADVSYFLRKQMGPSLSLLMKNEETDKATLVKNDVANLYRLVYGEKPGTIAKKFALNYTMDADNIAVDMDSSPLKLQAQIAVNGHRPVYQIKTHIDQAQRPITTAIMDEIIHSVLPDMVFRFVCRQQAQGSYTLNGFESA